jgi:hypothetical protein
MVAGGAVADVAVAELSTEVIPTPVLDGATAELVTGTVPLVAEAEIPDPVVKVAWDEVIPEAEIPVLVGRVVSVPLTGGGVEVGALPVPEIVLEPVPTGVVVVVSVPFPTGVVVGALPETVGALEIYVDVGTIPVDPRMLERMLPRPVESEVAEDATTESVGVGVTSTPVEGMILAMIDDKISEETGGVVDAAAEESTPVLGPVIPAVVGSGRRLLRIEEIRSGVVVVDAAAEESTPVLGPVIPAVDEAAADESVVVGVGSRTLLSKLLRTGTRPSVDEEAAAVEAAVPEPEIPEVMLSEVESGLAVEVGSELEDVKTPPGPNVIPLPPEVAAEDAVDSGSVVDEVVGRTITEGIPPVDAPDDGSRALERNDASGSLVLSLVLELDVAAAVSLPTTVVSEIITVVVPSELEAAESLAGVDVVPTDPVEDADPELDPPTSLVSPLNRSDNDRLVDLEWPVKKS